MRYITKGDLLALLGDKANTFTMFMLDPTAFGVTEPMLSGLRIAKQQFDWTSGLNLDLPEIQQLISVIHEFGGIDQECVDKLSTIADSPELDSFMVVIKAQDDITLTNSYGAVVDANKYRVTAEIRNNTKHQTFAEDFFFDYIPVAEDINNVLSARIRQLKMQ